MKFDQVAILLTCHSFDDFPVYYEGAEADSLLASWTALWHPALIVASGKKPGWYRVDSLPTDGLPRLLITPQPYVEQLEAESVQRTEQEGGRVIRDQAEGRQALLDQALADLAVPTDLDQELVADFLALGFAYLQIELLTRQMRYATQVEETAFEANLVEASAAMLGGDVETARTRLQCCYDFLTQEREHYYAVDVYLVDIGLLAESLLGAPLAKHLQATHHSNLLLEASCLSALATQQQDTAQELRQAVEAGRIGLLGGEFRELPLSLLASDTIRHQFQLGRQQFQQTLGRPPTVYGRRTFGLTPSLPQILVSMGFLGAVHSTFDGGRFPEASQSKSRWEGTGQYSLDAIIRAPLDAMQPATFLKLATNLSESMDMDHIATRCFVHWAGQTSPWFEELQRVTKFTTALGRFVTVEEYFQETYDPGMHESFRADQYRSPRLDEQVAGNDPQPISVWPRYWATYFQRLSELNGCTLRLMINNDGAAREAYRRADEQIKAFHLDPLSETATAPDSASTVNVSSTATAIAGVLGKQATSDDERGQLLLNPLSFPRRVPMTVAGMSPGPDQPLYVAKLAGEKGPDRFVADMPGMGVAVVRNNGRAARPPRKLPPPMAEEFRLRNEFLDLEVDPATGGLRSLRSYGSRSNLLTQQLAVRQQASADQQSVTYSSMVADAVTVLESDTLFGSIEAQGRLVDADDQVLARFKLLYELWRGSRVVRVNVTFEDVIQLDQSPWTNYVGARFAWSNEAADLSRSLNDCSLPTTAKRFEAPLFVRIDDGHETTTLLTGGLPYHVRSGRRMMDTLMIVKGERQRQFQFGLGVNLKQPMREAFDFMAPRIAIALDGRLPANPSAWFFHVDARNVIATTWQPMWHDDAIVGIQVRLCETTGRGTRVKLRSVRPFESALKVDGTGQEISTCEVAHDQLTIDISPFEQASLEATFADEISAS